jgi:hypothetical protein
MHEYTAVETLLHEAKYRNEHVKIGHVKTIKIMKEKFIPALSILSPSRNQTSLLSFNITYYN